MSETEAVSKEVTRAAGNESKCGPDTGFSPPKPACNGNNHHNQGTDIDNSYVFVSGADTVDTKDSAVESVKIGDPHTGEVNGSGLVTGSGESGGSNSISSHNDSSANPNGEYGDQIETPEACQGSQDVFVGGGVDCELQTVSVGSAEDEVKFAGEDRVVVVDVGVKAEGEVNLSAEVVENGQREVFQQSSLDLESKSIKTREETDVVDDVGQGESADVSLNAEDEVKLLEEVTKTGELEASLSTSLYVDFECPINSKDKTDVVEGVVESQDVSLNAEDEVKFTEEVIQTSELEVPTSTSLDVDLKSEPIYSKEETQLVEGVSECELQDLSVPPEDEVKLPAEHEVPKSISLDLDMELEIVHTKEETHVAKDVVELELRDASVEASGEVKLPREVVETSDNEIPSSTSLDVDLESKSINSKEEKDVVEDVVEPELHDMCMNVHTEDVAKLSREVVEAVDQEISPSTSLDVDLESISKNSQEEKNVIEVELQDVCVKVHAEDKVKFSGVESADREISPSTSFNLDLESNPINRKEWTAVVEDIVERDMQHASVEAGNEVKLSGEALKTAEHEIPPSAPLDFDLLTMNPINTKEETYVVEDVDECKLKDVSLKIEHEKPSGEVVETAEDEVPTSSSSDLEMESHPTNKKKEIDVALEVVQCESQDSSMKAKDEVTLLEEVTETAEHEVSLSNSLDLDLESKSINTEDKINVGAKHESQDANVEAKDEIKLSGKVVEIAKPEVASSISLDLNLELSPTSTKEEVDVVASAIECDLQDANMQTEVDGKLSGEVVGNAEHEVSASTSDSSDVNKEGTANIQLETEDVEDIVDQVDGAPGSSNENLPSGEIVDIGNSQDSFSPVAPPSSSSENMTARVDASTKTKVKPFNFLIRVPRFEDEGLREQIRLAKLNIDDKTKLRDAIQVQIQEKRASTQIHGIDYEYAKGESRNARKSVRSKRMEIDSLQSVINKAKNALSVDDIDSQIYNMERIIQHETLQLKEEKQLIREIKQLKQLREQLSSNMGSQDEIKQALEQRGEAEERLKILRKELDVLKGKVLKAEAAAVEAGKKYDDENKKVRELQALFRASDEVRQTAYAQWQILRTELSKKSEYFFKYKDDAAVASNYVYSRDTDALYRVCVNNVERFMELWNTNGEFRRDYTKFNARSTVWRLGTLDGRGLGPDESPPVLPSYADARPNRIVSIPVKVDLASQSPILELKQERATESVTTDSKSMKKVTEEKNQRVTNKGSVISAQVNGLDTISSEAITHEEPKKSREEIEATKKAEEMERKEAESKLKEQRRVEALAKASEARERKKKQAEKLQMRAELKTLKEAEQKEKEREKRLRKKERKKAAATDVSDTNTCEIGLSSESAVETTSKDVEVKDLTSSVGSKKPKKHWLFGKQGKTKSSIPPPLRNRNKKKLQQWMWVGITSFAILFVFWMGNIGVFSGLSYKRRVPVMT